MENFYNKLKSEVHFKAKIEKGWHLYAIYVPYPEDGPLPTTIHYHKKKGNIKRLSNPAQSYCCL